MDEKLGSLGAMRVLCIPTLAPPHLSGAVGLRFGLSSAGSATLDMLGPEGLSAITDTTAGFLVRRYPVTTCMEVAAGTQRVFEDGLVTLDAIGLPMAHVPEPES